MKVAVKLRSVTIKEVATAAGRSPASIRMHVKVLKAMLLCRDICEKEFPHAKNACIKECLNFLGVRT